MKHKREWSTCDVCGVILTKDNEHTGSSETYPDGLISVSCQKYYGQKEDLRDFCRPCADQILTLVRKIQSLGKHERAENG